MNIMKGLAAVTQIIKDSIRAENAQDGLLEDVKSIISVANNEEGIDDRRKQHPFHVKWIWLPLLSLYVSNMTKTLKPLK